MNYTYTNLKVTIETIGPEKAAEFLAMNTQNYRNVNARVVSAYAADMKNGKWEANGEPIQISKSGILKNGQHRLMAIIKANVYVQMIVVYGVDDDVTVYDVAQKRSGRQIAIASGLSPTCSQNSTISAARFILTPKYGSVSSPTGTVIDYIKEHADEFDKAYMITKVGVRNSLCRNSACIAAVYCLLRLGKDENLLADFFTVVNTGFQSDRRESSSCIVLRNTLITPTSKTKNNNYYNAELFSVVLLSFQDFEAGRARKKTYRPDIELTNETIAKVRDLDRANNGIVELICG